MHASMKDSMNISAYQDSQGLETVEVTGRQAIVVSESTVSANAGIQPHMVNFSGQSNFTEVESRFEKRGKNPSVTVPRYLTIEPSLAMDWLEISWDELHIKERIGAGNYYVNINWFMFPLELPVDFLKLETVDIHFITLHRFIWNGSSC